MVVQARDDGCSADVDKWVDQGRLVEVDLTVLDGDVAVEYGRDGQDDVQFSDLDNGWGWLCHSVKHEDPRKGSSLVGQVQVLGFGHAEHEGTLRH